MDDPAHSNSREEDMDQFRKAKFGRTKSYAYGDLLSKAVSSNSQSKRNTAPGGGVTSLFAAANAARTRRTGLTTVDEDNVSTHTAAMSDEETEVDIGDSPCPPPNKGGLLLKSSRQTTRGPLERAHTFGTIRL